MIMMPKSFRYDSLALRLNKLVNDVFSPMSSCRRGKQKSIGFIYIIMAWRWVCAGCWGGRLGLKAQPSLELFLNLGPQKSVNHQNIMKKSRSVALNRPCSVVYLLHWIMLWGLLTGKHLKLRVGHTYKEVWVQESLRSWIMNWILWKTWGTQSADCQKSHMHVCQEILKSQQQKCSHIT